MNLLKFLTFTSSQSLHMTCCHYYWNLLIPFNLWWKLMKFYPALHLENKPLKGGSKRKPVLLFWYTLQLFKIPWHGGCPRGNMPLFHCKFFSEPIKQNHLQHPNINHAKQLSLAGDHLVKSPLHKAGPPRAGYQVLSFSKDRDSTTTLGKLFQRLITFTVNPDFSYV